MPQIDEALCEDEYSGIEFRNTILGRQPYVKGTGMAVWEFIMVAQAFEMDATQTSKHLQYPLETVLSSLNYYKTYHEEIDLAIAQNNIDEKELKLVLPDLRVFAVPNRHNSNFIR